MRKKVTAILSFLLFCMVMIAQDPVVDVPKNKGGWYDAQRLIAEANEAIAANEREAERDKIDIKDHAQKARQYLVEANKEIKAAYDALEAAQAAKKK